MLLDANVHADERQTIRQREPPPTPPRGRLAASIQRMPAGGRWALGLGLASLSGIAFLSFGVFSPVVMPSVLYGIANGLRYVVAFALALAAGFVLSRWWAVVALAVATAVGALVGGWVYLLASPPGAVEGLTGLSGVLVLFMFFAILTWPPLIIILLAGVGLGKHYGIALGQPYTLSAREATLSRWIAALGPVVAASLFTQQMSNMPGLLGEQVMPGVDIFPGILTAVVLAAACLLAGWLLRSWWGFVAAPVVYAGVHVLSNLAFGGAAGGAGWTAWTAGFALYIVLPAVVMSAIGTLLGMFTAGHGGQHLHYRHLPA